MRTTKAVYWADYCLVFDPGEMVKPCFRNNNKWHIKYAAICPRVSVVAGAYQTLRMFSPNPRASEPGHQSQSPSGPLDRHLVQLSCMSSHSVKGYGYSPQRQSTSSIWVTGWYQTQRWITDPNGQWTMSKWRTEVFSFVWRSPPSFFLLFFHHCHPSPWFRWPPISS